jgi:hypothetical protein
MSLLLEHVSNVQVFFFSLEFRHVVDIGGWFFFGWPNFTNLLNFIFRK